MEKKHIYFLSGAACFAICAAIGFWIAIHKPLWNDELYSLTSSIYGRTYGQMFLGQINEGNNSPLFYVLQRLQCDLFRYQPPLDWIQGHWQNSSNAYAQIFLRIQPVFFMSMSMAMIFYHFFRRYSLFLAFLSLFIFLSSYMLWVYWAEARPYALEVFLTTAQAILFLKCAQGEGVMKKNIWMLSVIHFFMALTFIFSLGSIGAVVFLLLMLRKVKWQELGILFFVPVAIVIFYYAHAPRYQFYFDLTPEQLIRDNISRERFYILFVFLASLGLSYMGSMFKWQLPIEGQWLKHPVAFVMMTLLVFCAACVVMGILWISKTPANQGFMVSNRYFIYLMPLGIIMTTMLIESIYKTYASKKWIQYFLFVIIAYWLVFKFYKIVPSAIHSILGQ